jgi:ribonucleoside-diphosphate reductase alpha chain
MSDEVAPVKRGADFSPFARGIYEAKYAFKDEQGNPIEDWPDTAKRVANAVLGKVDRENIEEVADLISKQQFMPGGRYLYAAGREYHQTQNCLLMRCGDSREEWSELLANASMALMTGAGIGIDYSDVRASGNPIKKTGGIASGPISVMEMVNECGRHIMQGGSRRSAIWAGLNWKHEDIFKFIDSKNWSPEVRELKEKDFNFPATLDMTNISVLLDDEFFEAYEDSTHELHEHAKEVYYQTVKSMVKTAEPGFSIDVGENAGETLRNACTEVTSSDDSDICNLGSINLANVETLEEFENIIDKAVLFLIAGTVYSHVPYKKVDEIRTKNRRLGLGLMGIHEWLLKRGYKYEENEEFTKWLEAYKRVSRESADKWSDILGLSTPIKVRAIAPTGTIGIVAETTTGIEPIYCAAFKRRYLKDGTNWVYEYVIDPTAKRLIDKHGVNPNDIEDAYSLSYNVEKRIAFQAYVQKYVDHAISSTVNIPAPITDKEDVLDFAEMLYPYLPQLRGVTVYPDGARGGQPLTPVTYEEAIKHEGVVFETEEETCVGGVCGA